MKPTTQTLKFSSMPKTYADLVSFLFPGLFTTGLLMITL